MHTSIIALAYIKPTIFLMPKDDVKVLDMVSYLGLEMERYITDICQVM